MFAELVNHLWQSTLVAVALAALTLALRDNGAHVRYWLWWAASVKFLVPLALLAALGKALAGGESPIQLPEWSATLGTIAEPLAGPPSSGGLLLLLAGCWMIGSLSVLGRGLAAALRLRTVLRTATPWAQPLPTTPIVPAVCCTTSPIEPALVGIAKPKLLLPRGIDERLTREQLDAVLAHELSHWRRRDNLTAAVHMVVEALFWFHPLVWWIGARLVEERERACDEAVLGAGHDGRKYAEGILDVCEHYVASSLRCAAGVSGADLARRVLDIARNRAMSDLTLTKKVALAATALSAVAAPILAGFAQAPPFESVSAPLVRIAPEYPPDALAAGLEGFAWVEFTITPKGTVTDAVLVDASSPELGPSALAAIQRWRYPPPARDGVPTAVRGMREVLRYELER